MAKSEFDAKSTSKDGKGYNLSMYSALTLAQRILLSRRDLDWKQENLAEASGVSRTYISNIERGRITNVGVEVIFALAKALGVSPQYLLGLTEDPLAGVPDGDAEERQQFDAVTQEFLNLFQQLSPQQQSTLLSIAKVIKAADEPKIIGGVS
ncbi:MAG: XRE family transcriptional regulator [Desulfurellales bacterium]|nr:MAG: XRE family transcriptional regulator [Desulfurellales bacterium]